MAEQIEKHDKKKKKKKGLKSPKPEPTQIERVKGEI